MPPRGLEANGFGIAVNARLLYSLKDYYTNLRLVAIAFLLLYDGLDCITLGQKHLLHLKTCLY